MADHRYDVVVVGTGFSGLCAAIKLREAGIDDLLILEKSDAVGGTWRDNDYPGAACDVMAQLYSLSFAPNPHWTSGYPGQAEILAYLNGVVDRYELRPLIRFGTEVTEQVFDDENDEWQVETSTGESVRARIVIAGTGPLHVPKIPAFPDAQSFAGNQFHSSKWDHGVDLSGKSVAVIGTGASAVQIIPAIAEVAKAVSVFQRTPHWVLPRLDRRISAGERAFHRAVPGSRVALRGAIYTSHEAVIGAFLNPKLMNAVRTAALLHLRRQVSDTGLRRMLTPDYQVGCKRIIMSSHYYPALQRDNVTLVTAGVAGLTPEGVRASDGTVVPADVIVYATGFKSADQVAQDRVRGRDGIGIGQLWKDGAQAYFGVVVNGLPNYFLTVGPNTGVGNQSIVFVIETQVELIVRCIRSMIDGEFSRVEVKPHIQAEFNRALQRRSSGTVWTAGGCDSWYLDDAGVNRAIWPGSTWAFRRRVRRVGMGDFEFSRPEDREPAGTYDGPALLTDSDGGQLVVHTRLLATYEPLVNTIKWTGRVRPQPELTDWHHRVNQPISLQVAGREPVEGVLTDADPWGGAHLMGWGRSPYAIDLEAQFHA